jgi:GNAT superfamily N-acetyltransferase
VATDASTLNIRPLDPDDVERLRRLFYRLSPRTRYFRFFSLVTDPPEGCLQRLASVDHRTREALAALSGDEIVAVARYDRLIDRDSVAEVAVVVEDSWQRHGVARDLMTALARSARDRGVETFTGTTLSENPAIGAFVRALAAEPHWRWDGGCRLVEVDLRRELVAATPARQSADSGVSGSITGRIRAGQVAPKTKPPTTSVR